MLVVSKRSCVSGSAPQSMSFGDTHVDFSDFVKNLGVTLDWSLSVHQQVMNACTTSYIELRRISSIRHYLTGDTTKHSFPLSHFPDWTIAMFCVMLCSKVYRNTFWTVVGWCFEPRQPEKVTSGLNTNFTLSPNYSFHKSSYHKSCF